MPPPLAGMMPPQQRPMPGQMPPGMQPMGMPGPGGGGMPPAPGGQPPMMPPSPPAPPDPPPQELLNLGPNVAKQEGDKASEEDLKKMAKWVKEAFEKYERVHTDRFEKAVQAYEHWTGKAPRRSFTWQNAVHVPITFEAEQTISPRIFSALFPNESPVDIELVGEADDDEGARILDLIKHYFRVSDVQGVAVQSIQECVLLGTGYMYAPWLFRTAWQVGKDGKRYQALVDNRPDCEHVSFFEFFPHPAKRHMSDGLPIIRRRVCDAEYLKDLAAMPQFKFINLEEALKSESVMQTGTTSNILDKDGKAYKHEMKKNEEYEILDYWGPWDHQYLEGDKPFTHKALPYNITVINRKVVIRQMPNPYNHQRPPFIKFTLYPDIKPSWFGIGTGQVGCATQERVNKIVNQRLDNVDLVMNKQGFYNGNDPLVNVKKLMVSMPGQWHKVSDTMYSVRWMDIPDVTASSYQEENIAKSDYREATGASAPMMPTDEGQHRTAAGINLLQGAAGERFKPVLRRMETDMISDLAEMYFSNLQQFMKFPEWVQATSDEGKKKPIQIKPEDIQRKAKFIPTGVSELMNKEVQIGQLPRFKEVTQQDPTVNRSEINKRIGQLMGFKDLDKLLVVQQPVQMGPGQLPPQAQQYIQQRLQEGATPHQIKLELLGQQPGDQGSQGTQGQPMDQVSGAQQVPGQMTVGGLHAGQP